MKKLLGISLVAMLAVSPMMAMAEAPEGGVAVGSATIAAEGPYYETVTATATADIASTSYVKGAYNDAIKAVNKTYNTLKDVDDSLTSRLNTIQSNADTSGSIEYAVKHGAANADYDNSTTIKGAIDALDGRLDSAEAFMSNVDSAISSAVKTGAAGADYDNSESELSATTIQGAIDELDGRLDSAETHIGTMASLTTTEKGNLVGAINEVNSAVEGLDTALNSAQNDIKTGLVATLRHSGTVVHTTWDNDNTVAVAAETVDTNMNYSNQGYYSTYDMEIIGGPARP